MGWRGGKVARWRGGSNQSQSWPPNTHTIPHSRAPITSATLQGNNTSIAPALWQQNVPQLPLRPHPHPRLTKPMMIPMTIFYSRQVATAQRVRRCHPLSQGSHLNPTNNQTLPPPLVEASRSPLSVPLSMSLSVSVSVTASVSLSVTMSMAMSVPRCPRLVDPFAVPFPVPARYHISSFKVFSCNQPRTKGDQGTPGGQPGLAGPGSASQQTVARCGWMGGHGPPPPHHTLAPQKQHCG